MSRFIPRDELAEILRCLRETLREPAFASAVALLLCTERCNYVESRNVKHARYKQGDADAARGS